MANTSHSSCTTGVLAGGADAASAANQSRTWCGPEISEARSRVQTVRRKAENIVAHQGDCRIGPLDAAKSAASTKSLTEEALEVVRDYRRAFGESPRAEVVGRIQGHLFRQDVRAGKLVDRTRSARTPSDHGYYLDCSNAIEESVRRLLSVLLGAV